MRGGVPCDVMPGSIGTGLGVEATGFETGVVVRYNGTENAKTEFLFGTTGDASQQGPDIRRVLRTLELILGRDDFERVLGLEDDDAGQAHERGVLALLD